MHDEIETIDKNPKSWTAWKRESERLQKIIDLKNIELLAYREVQGNVVGWKWRLVDMASSETSAWRICLLPHSPGGGAGFETESIPLYTAPPLPVVPGSISKIADGDSFKYVKDGVRFSVGYASGWNECRAEMLKGVTFRENGVSSTKHFRENSETSTNSQVIPDGCVIVPINPTEEMMLHKSECQHHAWDDHDCAIRQTRRLVWANMIAAAPKPVGNNG